MNSKRMNSQMSTKQTKAQPNKNEAKNGEKNICALKRLLKVKAVVYVITSPRFPPYRLS